MQLQLREHDWKLMTLTDVEILGVDSDGEPFGAITEEPQQGVNCGVCGEAWSVNPGGCRPMSIEVP